jgi:hypothetical protein
VQDILVPVSPGELIDKLTILEIKAERIRDAAKLANVRHELQLLQDTWRASGHAKHDIEAQWAELRRINGELWDIEDHIRDEERAQRFEAEFIRLARAVYVTNDERARVKREINQRLGSSIVEEKSYADYGKGPAR